ncbi:MAG: hypothetical protein QOJ15_6264 [Bradyrhizobium sp.]|nr:hypothetical protein [Bradyrhizobium sp.]
MLLAATGVLGGIGGAMWAVLTGVPLPIAIMAGYCTVVGAVYLAIAPLAYRVLSQIPKRAVSKKAPLVPNYTAWRRLDVYEVQDAAKLWVDIGFWVLPRRNVDNRLGELVGVP